MNESASQQTPLYGLHQSLGATLVNFAGYALPVRYAPGIINEHLHTRAAASLFDVSHMGMIRIAGGDGLHERFERLVPADVLGLRPGMARYSMLLNTRGGIIDDLMVVRPPGDADRRGLLLVVNAANKAKVLAHVQAGLGAEDQAGLLADRALLALQGPLAAAVLGRFCDAPGQLKFMRCGEYPLAGFGAALVSRTGYTGEDGFEIALAAGQAEAFARALLATPAVRPAGLGARDSLRLEAGLPLHGHDLDEATTPVEAGLGWVVDKRRRAAGGFPGFAILRHEWSAGPPRLRVGLRPLGKALAREGTAVLAAGRQIGVVTSGGYSPSLAGPVCMGYVEPAFAVPGTAVELVVRGEALPGRVESLPFVPHRYVR